MIRTYHPTDDDDQIVAVWRASSELAHPFLKEDFQEQEASNIRNIYLPNTKTWVYEKEDKVVGFIAMIGHEIGAIFVHPEAARQSIGSRLLAHIRPDYELLTVKVFEKNVIGRSFYEKSGFTFLEKEMHEPTGEMLLVLELK